MKRSAVIVCVLLFVGSATPYISISQQRANPAGGNRGGLSVNVQQLTDTFYITRIKAGVELSDDQYNKVVPFLNKYLDERRQAAQRHTRALNQLRQANLRNASDDEIKPLVEELDKADADLQSSIARFQAGVDPILTPAQQGKLRIFRENTENQLTNMVRVANGWVAPTKPTPDPAPASTEKPASKPR